MKHLFLASLMASALASFVTAAAAPVPTELCVGGSLPQPTQFDGAAKVTNCQWPNAAMLTTDPAATSLAVSGGASVGEVLLDLGSPTNAFALTIANGFAVAGQLLIGGTLLAGSSVSITGLNVTMPSATGDGAFVHLGGLRLTDASLTITDSIVTSGWSCTNGCSGIYLPSGIRSNIAIRDTKLTLSSRGSFNGVQMEGKMFDDATLTISGNTVTCGSGTGYGIAILRYSTFFATVRKGFLGMASSTNNGAAAAAKPGRQRAAAHVFDPASVDWSTVSDATARADYGKVTYKITSNTFVNMDQPWNILEIYGADIAITFSKNVITTGKLTDATILQLPATTFLPEENPAKFTVSGNRLVALDGTRRPIGHIRRFLHANKHQL